MNYRLNEKNGKVPYLTRMNKTVVGGETARESAEWILENGKPEKSGEFEGYPIKALVNGNEYFFSGEWLMGGAKDVLGEGARKSACELGDVEEVYSRKGADKPQRKRRIKDVVCE